MNLYMVDRNIQDLLLSTVDPETGELQGSEEVLERLNALQMERETVLTNLVKEVANLRGEQAMLKAEIARLKAMQDAAAKKEARILGALEIALDGQGADFGIAKASYRAAKRLDVSDEATAVAWLVGHGHADCVKQAAPTLDKRKVQKLIDGGEEPEGCSVLKYNSFSLK